MVLEHPMDRFYMEKALEQARIAASEGEIPVGACVVRGEEIVSVGRNSREKNNDPLGHAEIMAIEAACRKLGTWRLSDCRIYVTLEPCPMCAGAIINTRIQRVIYGARDERMGCLGSVCNLACMQMAGEPLVTSGVMAEESLALLQEFFGKLRKRSL